MTEKNINKRKYLFADKQQLLKIAKSSPYLWFTQDKVFKKDNKVVIDMAKRVDKWLHGYMFPCIAPIVNSMGIYLALPKHIKKLNSILLVTGRGSGKSELLYEILAKSNPDYFVVLNEKTFESELVTEKAAYYHNKIIVRDDIIPLFLGMSTKQREQLLNFWVSLLEGRYARKGSKLENVKTMILFGIAAEMYLAKSKEILISTFSDRAPSYIFSFSDDLKREILEHRIDGCNTKYKNCERPIIKLPFPEGGAIDDAAKKRIEFPKDRDMELVIIDLAMELDEFAIQSFARSQDYIRVFMMCNALLNGRTKVTWSDLKLYMICHQFFVKSGQALSIDLAILKEINEHPDLDDKIIMEKLGISRGTYYKYKKRLLEKGILKNALDSLDREDDNI